MTRLLDGRLITGSKRLLPVPVSLRTLTAALVASFAIDNVLLLAFLGQVPELTAALALILPAALAFITYKAMPGDRSIDLQTVLVCLIVAVLLLVLGGRAAFSMQMPTGRFAMPYLRTWAIIDGHLTIGSMGEHSFCVHRSACILCRHFWAGPVRSTAIGFSWHITV
ncbi:MAG: hypothetical protein ACSLE1_19070 [Sphingobium sp.]